MFPSKFREPKFDKFPIDAGIGPESELLDKSTSYRLLSYPTERGNLPVSLFELKSKDSRLWLLQDDKISTS